MKGSTRCGTLCSNCNFCVNLPRVRIMSIIKHLCTCLLVLVLLVPAISAQDDAIRLSAVLSNGSPADDAVSAVGHFLLSGDDSGLATLLERLENLHVGSI